jgi:hypothetical protein
MRTLTPATEMHRIPGVARRSMVQICGISAYAWRKQPSIHVMGAVASANAGVFGLTDGTHQRPLEPDL